MFAQPLYYGVCLLHTLPLRLLRATFTTAFPCCVLYYCVYLVQQLLRRFLIAYCTTAYTTVFTYCIILLQEGTARYGKVPSSALSRVRTTHYYCVYTYCITLLQEGTARYGKVCLRRWTKASATCPKLSPAPSSLLISRVAGCEILELAEDTLTG